MLFRDLLYNRDLPVPESLKQFGKGSLQPVGSLVDNYRSCLVFKGLQALVSLFLLERQEGLKGKTPGL